MNFSHDDIERMEQRAEARAQLELELERDLKAVENKAHQAFQRSMQKAEPKTMNEVLRSGITSPAAYGGQLLKQMAETHSKMRESKVI